MFQKHKRKIKRIKYQQDENGNVILDKQLQKHINKYNLNRENLDTPITKEDLLKLNL